MAEEQTTPFSLNIDPEAVNKVIAEAILQSTVGEQIKKSADDYVNKFRDNWQFRQHVDKSVETILSAIIREEIDKHRDVIAAFVQEQLTEEKLNEIMKKMWEKWDRGW